MIAAQQTTPKQASRFGAIYNDRDHLEGRDPRTMSQDELVAMGHAPMSPLQAIRAHCLDCCGGSAHEVGKCMARRCPSWPFRMGTSPWRARPSDEQRQAMQERGRRLARANKSLPPDAEDHGTGPLAAERKSLTIGRLWSLEVSTSGDLDVATGTRQDFRPITDKQRAIVEDAQRAGTIARVNSPMPTNGRP
jgi:hypothetical protein